MAKKSVSRKPAQRAARPAPDPRRVELAQLKRAKRLHVEVGREARALLVAQQRADRDVLAVIRELAAVGHFTLVDEDEYGLLLAKASAQADSIDALQHQLHLAETHAVPAKE